MLELFFTSAVFWVAVLLLFAWLHRRIGNLERQMEILERDVMERE